MLSFSTPSCAAPAGTSMVTSPSAVGVMRAVHTVAGVVGMNADAVPLPTTMSDSSNPITASLNVNVASNGAFCGVAGPVISTVGVSSGSGRTSTGGETTWGPSPAAFVARSEHDGTSAAQVGYDVGSNVDAAVQDRFPAVGTDHEFIAGNRSAAIRFRRPPDQQRRTVERDHHELPRRSRHRARRLAQRIGVGALARNVHRADGEAVTRAVGELRHRVAGGVGAASDDVCPGATVLLELVPGDDAVGRFGPKQRHLAVARVRGQTARLGRQHGHYRQLHGRKVFSVKYGGRRDAVNHRLDKNLTVFVVVEHHGNFVVTNMRGRLGINAAICISGADHRTGVQIDDAVVSGR